MRKMPARKISFPARTPAPAIRRRSSQGLLRARFVGVVGALLLLSCWQSLATYQSVTLSWDANPEPDIAGYRVYYRTAVGDSSEVVDVGNTTTFTVPSLGDGITYLFSVTAYNNASLESQPSAEVSYTAGSVSDTTLLTVVNGTGGGNYVAGKQVVVSAKPPPEGSQFAGWIGDVPILANPSAATTTATIPSLNVTITATYSASD